MKPSHIYAIIRKQLKDTFRNKPTLVQFVMFPAIAAILTLSAGEFELPKRYFVNLFSVMYVCMAPILILSAIISEEKEKGSLRMLMMSNVKPMEYLLGIGAYVFVFCMAGVLFMGLLGKFSLQELWMFLLLNACGILISSVIGAVIIRRLPAVCPFLPCCLLPLFPCCQCLMPPYAMWENFYILNRFMSRSTTALRLFCPHSHLL